MHKRNGFTIVELLVVIVIIAILAALIIFTFLGIKQRADKTSLETDLTNNSKRLKSYQALYDSYPMNLDSSNCPTAPTADQNYCLKFAPGISLGYYSDTKLTFTLRESSTAIGTPYQLTNDTPPVAYVAPTGAPSVAPSNMTILPGSWQITIAGNTGRTGYAGKLDATSSVTLLQHLHRGVSPAVTNGTINVDPTGYTDPSCSGYLGDVTWTVWLSNSAGSSPSVTVSDYWD